MATQGAYLIPRSHTPVWEKAYDEAFTAALDRKLNAITTVQAARRNAYHEAADEWPIGHTPPEVKERYLAEMRALEAMMDVTSDEDGSGDEADHTNPSGKACVERARLAGKWTLRTRPQEIQVLPTPPPSARSPLPVLQERKRQRDKEEEYPRKTRVISTARLDIPEGDKPDGSQVKGRKRRRTDNADDEGERNREHCIKARKTAIPRQQNWGPPPRPEAG